MLAIKIDETSEWWVSGAIFDRLIQAALDAGAPREIAQWRDVANANGGLALALLPPDQAQLLRTVLRDTALREIARLGQPDPSTADGGYVVALRRLVDASVG